MSEFKNVLVSLEELNKMSFGDVQKTDFYYFYEKEKIHIINKSISSYFDCASDKNLYIRKEVDWWENIPKHGILVWNDKGEVCLVRSSSYDIRFPEVIAKCTPLTDKEIIEHFTGVKGE